MNVLRPTRTRLNLSLRGPQRRGNLHELDDAKHTSTIRRCYADRSPRYARNNKVGAMRLRALSRAHCNLSLRGAQRRGNLDELDDVEHTSAHRRCHADEIATLRPQ